MSRKQTPTQNFEALVTVPRTVADWDGVIADLAAKHDEALAQEFELANDDTDLDLCFTPGAEARAIQRADQLRHARERIEFLKRALDRAAQKRDEAKQADAADALDRRVADAQIHARNAVVIARRIDAILRQLGGLVGQLGEEYRELLRSRDIHDVAAHRLHSDHALRGAIHAAGGADLARFFDLPVMPPDQRRPLGEREARKWERLLSRPTKAGAARARVDTADPKLVAKIEGELLDRHPHLWVDADSDTPESINEKSARLNALIVERLDAGA